jgi:hypothetical protein
MLPESYAYGVKEWAVVVEAIRSGKQCYLLKKGGLTEPDHPEFDRPSGMFGLIPTWSKQLPIHLRSESCREFADQVAGDDTTDTFSISTVVDITEQVVLSNPIRAHRLWDCHVWRADYITERINTRPEVPLHLLFVRAYNLPTPIEVKRTEKFGDTRHWISLEQNASLDQAQVVLKDPEYKRETRIVREKLNA